MNVRVVNVKNMKLQMLGVELELTRILRRVRGERVVGRFVSHRRGIFEECR